MTHSAHPLHLGVPPSSGPRGVVAGANLQPARRGPQALARLLGESSEEKQAGCPRLGFYLQPQRCLAEIRAAGTARASPVGIPQPGATPQHPGGLCAVRSSQALPAGKACTGTPLPNPRAHLLSPGSPSRVRQGWEEASQTSQAAGHHREVSATTRNDRPHRGHRPWSFVSFKPTTSGFATISLLV